MTQPYDPDLFPIPIDPSPELYPTPGQLPDLLPLPESPYNPNLYPEPVPGFDPDLFPNTYTG
jgi:hypothetical protein